MRKIPKAIYLTADEIEAAIADLEREASLLPVGAKKQAVLKKISQLRMYADLKRWSASPLADSKSGPDDHV